MGNKHASGGADVVGSAYGNTSGYVRSDYGSPVPPKAASPTAQQFATRQQPPPQSGGAMLDASYNLTGNGAAAYSYTNGSGDGVRNSPRNDAQKKYQERDKWNRKNGDASVNGKQQQQRRTRQKQQTQPQRSTKQKTAPAIATAPASQPKAQQQQQKDTPTQTTKNQQKNFLTQFFTRSPNAAVAHAATNDAQKTTAASCEDLLSISEKVVLLKDRPALRLDTRLICKYEILSVIGKGSFSQVLRVQDRLTRQFYAVKLVSTDSDFGAVNNELSILSRVQHPYVIRLEEVFRGISKLFIVMEMASGGEMYDRVVAKGRYTEAEARQAVRQLLTGLDYLHGIHVTHRDLKPENLLYSDERPEARLLITDFGLAHQSKNAEEKMFETCGTPEYIAPEILLRLPYTNKVDLWAVGVIAYILMSGIMPFDDDNRSRLYSHIITADYVYYPMFWAGSELAKQFVDDLLDTSTERRLSATEALNHEWILGNEKPRFSVSIRARQKRRANSPTSTEHSMQRTKSSRSIRSVTRSDHGHRVDPREVDKLADDLEKLAKNRHKHAHNNNNSNNNSNNNNNNSNSNNKDHHQKKQQHGNCKTDDYPSAKTKHYGMI